MSLRGLLDTRSIPISTNSAAISVNTFDVSSPALNKYASIERHEPILDSNQQDVMAVLSDIGQLPSLTSLEKQRKAADYLKNTCAQFQSAALYALREELHQAIFSSVSKAYSLSYLHEGGVSVFFEIVQHIDFHLRHRFVVIQKKFIRQINSLLEVNAPNGREKFYQMLYQNVCGYLFSRLKKQLPFVFQAIIVRMKSDIEHEEKNKLFESEMKINGNIEKRERNLEELEESIKDKIERMNQSVLMSSAEFDEFRLRLRALLKQIGEFKESYKLTDPVFKFARQTLSDLLESLKEKFPALQHEWIQLDAYIQQLQRHILILRNCFQYAEINELNQKEQDDSQSILKRYTQHVQSIFPVIQSKIKTIAKIPLTNEDLESLERDVKDLQNKLSESQREYDLSEKNVTQDESSASEQEGDDLFHSNYCRDVEDYFFLTKEYEKLLRFIRKVRYKAGILYEKLDVPILDSNKDLNAETPVTLFIIFYGQRYEYDGDHHFYSIKIKAGDLFSSNLNAKLMKEIGRFDLDEHQLVLFLKNENQSLMNELSLPLRTWSYLKCIVQDGCLTLHIIPTRKIELDRSELKNKWDFLSAEFQIYFSEVTEELRYQAYQKHLFNTVPTSQQLWKGNSFSELDCADHFQQFKKLYFFLNDKTNALCAIGESPHSVENKRNQACYCLSELFLSKSDQHPSLDQQRFFWGALLNRVMNLKSRAEKRHAHFGFDYLVKKDIVDVYGSVKNKIEERMGVLKFYQHLQVQRQYKSTNYFSLEDIEQAIQNRWVVADYCSRLEICKQGQLLIEELIHCSATLNYKKPVHSRLITSKMRKFFHHINVVEIEKIKKQFIFMTLHPAEDNYKQRNVLDYCLRGFRLDVPLRKIFNDAVSDYSSNAKLFNDILAEFSFALQRAKESASSIEGSDDSSPKEVRLMHSKVKPKNHYVNASFELNAERYDGVQTVYFRVSLKSLLSELKKKAKYFFGRCHLEQFFDFSLGLSDGRVITGELAFLNQSIYSSIMEKTEIMSETQINWITFSLKTPEETLFAWDSASSEAETGKEWSAQSQFIRTSFSRKIDNKSYAPRVWNELTNKQLNAHFKRSRKASSVQRCIFDPLITIAKKNIPDVDKQNEWRAYFRTHIESIKTELLSLDLNYVEMIEEQLKVLASDSSVFLLYKTELEENGWFKFLRLCPELNMLYSSSKSSVYLAMLRLFKDVKQQIAVRSYLIQHHYRNDVKEFILDLIEFAQMGEIKALFGEKFSGKIIADKMFSFEERIFQLVFESLIQLEGLLTPKKMSLISSNPDRNHLDQALLYMDQIVHHEQAGYSSRQLVLNFIEKEKAKKYVSQTKSPMSSSSSSYENELSGDDLVKMHAPKNSQRWMTLSAQFMKPYLKGKAITYFRVLFHSDTNTLKQYFLEQFGAVDFKRRRCWIYNAVDFFLCKKELPLDSGTRLSDLELSITHDLIKLDLDAHDASSPSGSPSSQGLYGYSPFSSLAWANLSRVEQEYIMLRFGEQSKHYAYEAASLFWSEKIEKKDKCVMECIDQWNKLNEAKREIIQSMIEEGQVDEPIENQKKRLRAFIGDNGVNLRAFLDVSKLDEYALQLFEQDIRLLAGDLSMDHGGGVIVQHDAPLKFACAVIGPSGKATGEYSTSCSTYQDILKVIDNCRKEASLENKTIIMRV